MMAQGKISDAQKWLSCSNMKNKNVPVSSNLNAVVISNNNLLNINNPFSMFLKSEEKDTFKLDFNLNNIKVFIIEIDNQLVNIQKKYDTFLDKSKFIIHKVVNIEFIIITKIVDSDIKTSKLLKLLNDNDFELVEDKVLIQEELIKNFYFDFNHNNYFCFVRQYG